MNITHAILGVGRTTGKSLLLMSIMLGLFSLSYSARALGADPGKTEHSAKTETKWTCPMHPPLHR